MAAVDSPIGDRLGALPAAGQWDCEAPESPIGIVADIGGTHARFAVAHVTDTGVIALNHRATLRTVDFPSFEAAFLRYADRLPAMPRQGVFAIASPITGDDIKLTNSPWVLRPSALADRIGLESVALINDFGAIARGISRLPAEALRALAGPPLQLPRDGTVSIVGPGSGLGVALLCRQNGEDRVIPCEGGHVGFAPADQIDAFILRFISERYPRVSAERLISGPGLVQIYVALAELEGRAIVPPHAIPLWRAALEEGDRHASAAVERWLMLLGTFAGDIALAHGATAVVLAGGILPRFAAGADMAPLLSRFVAKGRFEPMMRGIAVALVTHPDPGLFGAATLLDGVAA